MSQAQEEREDDEVSHSQISSGLRGGAPVEPIYYAGAEEILTRSGLRFGSISNLILTYISPLSFCKF